MGALEAKIGVRGVTGASRRVGESGRMIGPPGGLEPGTGAPEATQSDGSGRFARPDHPRSGRGTSGPNRKARLPDWAGGHGVPSRTSVSGGRRPTECWMRGIAGRASRRLPECPARSAGNFNPTGAVAPQTSVRAGPGPRAFTQRIDLRRWTELRQLAERWRGQAERAGDTVRTRTPHRRPADATD